MIPADLSRMEDDIDKGMLLLDRSYPMWHRFIDLKTFNFRHIDHCVLGQLATQFHDKQLAEVFYQLGMNYSFSDSIGYGFDTDGGDDAYQAMHILWMNKILRRKTEDKEVA